MMPVSLIHNIVSGMPLKLARPALLTFVPFRKRCVRALQSLKLARPASLTFVFHEGGGSSSKFLQSLKIASPRVAPTFVLLQARDVLRAARFIPFSGVRSASSPLGLSVSRAAALSTRRVLKTRIGAMSVTLSDDDLNFRDDAVLDLGPHLAVEAGVAPH